MSKSEFLIVPKGTKFAGPGKLGLNDLNSKSSCSFFLEHPGKFIEVGKVISCVFRNL